MQCQQNWSTNDRKFCCGESRETNHVISTGHLSGRRLRRP